MKFLMTLTLIVRSLREPEKLQQAVQHLAVKHVHYGVQPGHFTPFGNALLRTLKKSLGPGLQPRSRRRLGGSLPHARPHHETSGV